MPPTHEVTLSWRDGRATTIRAMSHESVLEAAERHDVALPFGCRTGACATCVGSLLAGAYRYRRPPRALKPKHVRDGYLLCCIACPTAECRLEVGAAVGAEMVENPWR